MDATSPYLFGIQHSNRDFTKPANWGKNIFNNAFPIALCCYMEAQGLEPAFLTLDRHLQINHQRISSSALFKISPASPHIFFGFEQNYLPYHQFVTGVLDAADVVISDKSTGLPLRAIEVKLTALPDHTTCHLSDDAYSSELVVRPTTIAYIALSIFSNLVDRGIQQNLLHYLSPICQTISDWTNETFMLSILNSLKTALCQFFTADIYKQQPIILQPIWKTIGKSPHLHENCLDVFVWSDLALACLFLNQAQVKPQTQRIPRPARSVIWLTKMLYDLAIQGRTNPAQITRQLVYGHQSDKSFAVSGRITHQYMRSPELTQPRIKKTEIKNIILNGGHTFLSPERRFDAIIVNTPGLFDH